MNEAEKKIIEKLIKSEREENEDVVFPEMGYLVEEMYREGTLSPEWKTLVGEYMAETPPGSDNFSYLDFIVLLYKTFH